MKQIKRTIAATALAGAVTISLTACGAPAESQSSTEDDAVLNVASPPILFISLQTCL